MSEKKKSPSELRDIINKALTAMDNAPNTQIWNELSKRKALPKTVYANAVKELNKIRKSENPAFDRTQQVDDIFKSIPDPLTGEKKDPLLVGKSILRKNIEYEKRRGNLEGVKILKDAKRNIYDVKIRDPGQPPEKPEMPDVSEFERKLIKPNGKPNRSAKDNIKKAERKYRNDMFAYERDLQAYENDPDVQAIKRAKNQIRSDIETYKMNISKEDLFRKMNLRQLMALPISEKNTYPIIQERIDELKGKAEAKLEEEKNIALLKKQEIRDLQELFPKNEAQDDLKASNLILKLNQNNNTNVIRQGTLNQALNDYNPFNPLVQSQNLEDKLKYSKMIDWNEKHNLDINPSRVNAYIKNRESIQDNQRKQWVLGPKGVNDKLDPVYRKGNLEQINPNPPDLVKKNFKDVLMAFMSSDGGGQLNNVIPY